MYLLRADFTLDSLRVKPKNEKDRPADLEIVDLRFPRLVSL